MDLDAYREEVKFKVTGGLLNLEIDDSAVDKVINASLREIQRYICSTKIITIPYSKCIDLTDYHVNSVTSVYRTNGIGKGDVKYVGTQIDPMQAAYWQLASGTGNLYNFQNYAYNYASWNTLQQIGNTISTDLAYYFDKSENKLYINTSQGTPDAITIEYVPRYDDVSQINSDYWIDMLVRLSVANLKIILGNIRTRYQQSNALWTQDGESMRNEGNAELQELRAALVQNTQLIYPVD